MPLGTGWMRGATNVWSSVRASLKTRRRFLARRRGQRVERTGRAAQNASNGGGSVDDALRPQIGGVRACRRPEEVLPPPLHPAVEGASVPEVETRQPRLPLGAKDGGGDRVGLA